MRNRTNRANNINEEIEVVGEIEQPTVEVEVPLEEPEVTEETTKGESKKAQVFNCITLNFRKNPGGDIINLIPANSIVTVVKKEKDWTKVKFEGKTGYVMSEFIKEV